MPLTAVRMSSIASLELISPLSSEGTNVTDNLALLGEAPNDGPAFGSAVFSPI